MARLLDPGESQGGLTVNQSKTRSLLDLWAFRCARCVPDAGEQQQRSNRNVPVLAPPVNVNVNSALEFVKSGRVLDITGAASSRRLLRRLSLLGSRTAG